LGALLLGLTARADYSATVLSFSPAAYWRLDETNAPPAAVATNLGTLATTATGSYLGGAAHPVAGALAGSSNTAASFDGVTGELGLPFHPALGLHAPFTVEAWVQPQQNPPAIDPAAVLCCLNFAGAGRLGWVLYQSGTRWNLRLGNTNGYTFDQNGSTIIQSGNWYHLAAVYDGTNATLYVNGAIDATGPVSSFAPNDTAPFEIGAAAAVGRYNNAVIDEVAAYTNALSDAEIQAHYQNGTNASPSTPYSQLVLAKDPLLYFRLDEPAFAPGLLPAALNLGSLGTNVNGLYQPGAAPGAAGVPCTGLGTTNRACRFDGLPGYVDLGADPGLDIQGPVTVIAWIKGNPAIRRFQCLVGKGDTSWRMTVDEDGLPAFADGLDNFDVIGTLNVNDGQWHQLAGVYDGGDFILYVDGVSNAVMAAPYAIDGSELFAAIGRAPDYENRFFEGKVDEVAIFTSALTAGQIRQIYESANVPPAILQPPNSQIVSEGASLTLTVAAIGTPPLVYQWTRNGTNLAGQTSASLTLDNAQIGDAGDYVVAISNAYGGVISPTARITVQSGPPTILQSPLSLARYAGGTATFAIAAGGTAPLSYQWRLNETAIPGATAASYILSDVQLTNAGEYRCTVTNAYGSTNSAEASLTVISAPADPYAAAVLADGPLAFWRLGETNGLVAHDYVGGHDGQFLNVALGQPGYSLFDPDKAVAFGPARNSYVGNIAGIGFGTSLTNAAFSVEAWVRCPPGQNGDVGIVAKGSGSGGEQFSLDLGSAGNYRFFVRDVGGGVQSAHSDIPPDNTWQHVVGVCDEPGGQLRLYVNGMEWAVASTSIGLLNSPQPVTIGSRQSGTAAYDLNWNGIIDEVAIYGYALNPNQVLAHFTARYPDNQPPAIGATPASITNYISLATTFTVDAAGTEPLAFQWRFYDTNIPGANSRAFTIASLDPTNAGDYSVLVSNDFGGTNSPTAQLTVLPIPADLDTASDLVMHLKFDGDYVDYSGRGNNGTNVGAPAFIAGEIGSQALQYASDGDASYNYLALGLRPDLQFSSNVNFSVACWVRLPADATPDDLPFLCNAPGSTFYPGYDFAPGWNPHTYETTGGWLWTLYDSAGNGVYGLGAVNSINDGNWHHLAHTFDRTGNALTYLDSVLVDARPIGHPDGSRIGDLDTGEPATIGQDPTGTYWGVGQVDLDDLGVWRRVLTPLEVAGMYVVGASNHVSFATVPVRITLHLAGGQLQATWPAGLLQSADEVSGPYTDVPGATSPFAVTASGAQKFYRVRQ
jgi:hypothetical protein